MDLGRSISSTLLQSPIMLTMKTIDAVTTVTLLAMLKITRLINLDYYCDKSKSIIIDILTNGLQLEIFYQSKSH